MRNDRSFDRRDYKGLLGEYERGPEDEPARVALVSRGNDNRARYQVRIRGTVSLGEVDKLYRTGAARGVIQIPRWFAGSDCLPSVGAAATGTSSSMLNRQT